MWCCEGSVECSSVRVLHSEVWVRCGIVKVESGKVSQRIGIVKLGSVVRWYGEVESRQVR